MAERALKKEFGCVGCASVKKVISCVLSIRKRTSNKEESAVQPIVHKHVTRRRVKGLSENIAREFPGRHDKGDGGSNRLIVVPFDIPAHLDYAMKGFSLFSSH